MYKRVLLGNEQYEFPSNDLQELTDHTGLFLQKDFAKLKHSLDDLGYLFIRKFHAENLIEEARTAVLNHIKESGEDKLDPKYPTDEGILSTRCGYGCLPFMEGKNCITHNPKVLNVLEGSHTRRFFQQLLSGPVCTFDFKWLRAIHRRSFTGAHVDNVYMGRGSPKLLTIWTPFGDNPLQMGALAVMEKSHKLPQFQHFQQTYGNCDLETEGVAGTGWFSENPREMSKIFGIGWKSQNFGLGDVLIFTSRTVHMSTQNLTEKVRISCDTRWQRQDEPVDPRYVGDSFAVKVKHGLHGKATEMSTKTIETLKNQWGFQ